MKAWHTNARELRAQGEKLQDIADRFGFTKQCVAVVVADVECPVNHNAIARKKIWAEIHAGKRPWPKGFSSAPREYTDEQITDMRDMIDRGYTRKQIGEKYGKTKNAIIGVINRDKARNNG